MRRLIHSFCLPLSTVTLLLSACEPSAATATSDAATNDADELESEVPTFGAVTAVKAGHPCGQSGINGVTPCVAGYTCQPAQLVFPAPPTGAGISGHLTAITSMTCQAEISQPTQATQPSGAECLSGVNATGKNCASPNVCRPSRIIIKGPTGSEKAGAFNKTFTVGIVKRTCQPPHGHSATGTKKLGEPCVSFIGASPGCASGLVCTSMMTFKDATAPVSYPASMSGKVYDVTFGGGVCTNPQQATMLPLTGVAQPLAPYPQSFFISGK